MADPTVRSALLAWYDREKRDLPWRRTKDPYAVWVSEIMCQQTRVDTVIPYYERFMARFPTPAALARADEDSVLALWSGLGYYRRARLLHAGAKEVVSAYGGRVPRDRDARRSLPGVGRYTAGAIGSIAFDRAEPVVDGNVARVIARLWAIASPLGTAETERKLWARAEALVPGPRPGDLNQALMELGARVCTPRAPGCAACPVHKACRAHATGVVEDLPVPRSRKPPRPVDVVAVVATRGRPRRVWLVRGREELYGGMWGLPTEEGVSVRDARSALDGHGIRARLQPEPRHEITHVLSHRKMSVRVYRATAAHAAETRDLRAVDVAALSDLGVSALTRRILASE